MRICVARDTTEREQRGGGNNASETDEPAELLLGNTREGEVRLCRPNEERVRRVLFVE